MPRFCDMRSEAMCGAVLLAGLLLGQLAAPSHAIVVKSTPSVDVFFNIFQDNQHLASKVVAEQLQTILGADASVRNVFYTTIGGDRNQTYDCPKCKLVKHKWRGDEVETLQLLYDHCQESQSDVVAYIHSKGTFHPDPRNNLFRHMLMNAVFSEPCLNMPSTCNVCGARFSLGPQHHFPGNMFVAKCSYIKSLYPPSRFAEAMGHVIHEHGKLQADERAKCSPWCKDFPRVHESILGLGRFSAEHWVGSHPSLQPCDVYPGNYTKGYRDLPTEPWTPELKVGPRYPLADYFWSGDTKTDCTKLLGIWNWRLFEWKQLYNDAKITDSWAQAAYKCAQGQA